MKKSLTEARTVQVENLTKALNIAKKAGIKDFSKSNSNNFSIPEYMLGAGRLNISDSKLADGTYPFSVGRKIFTSTTRYCKEYRNRLSGGLL